MKTTYFLLHLVTLTAAVSGCGKNNSDKASATANPQSEVAVALSGKTPEEVLQIKYTRAELKCQLWTQQSLRLDVSGAPTDSVVLDLKSNPTLPATLTLNGQIENHRIQIHVTVSSLEMWSGLRRSDSDGTVYVASNTPYAKVAYSIKSATNLGVGQNSTGDGGGKTEVGEKIKEQLLNGALSSEPVAQNGMVITRGAFRDYLQCVIDTDIKPEYQDQFRIEPRR